MMTAERLILTMIMTSVLLTSVLLTSVIVTSPLCGRAADREVGLGLELHGIIELLSLFLTDNYPAGLIREQFWVIAGVGPPHTIRAEVAETWRS